MNPLRRLRSLHHNQDGAIGVLVLLTIWCLVGLVAMLWNTADYAVRRQRIQTAADSTAYASAMWTSRALNQTTAQNILIAQDASADIIFRAAIDTDKSITGELAAEVKYLDAIAAQTKLLRSRLPGLIARIQTEYGLLNTSIALVQSEASDGTISFSTANDKIEYQNKIRQASYAANWVQTTYVPQLTALASEVMNAQLTDQMIEEARETIGTPGTADTGTEYGILESFEEQINTAPADTSERMKAHEEDLYQDQQELLDALPATQQAQMTALAGYYHVLANDGAAPAQLRPPTPVQVAPAVPSIAHVDSIRLAYPTMGRSPDVTLDPINPNTRDFGDSDIVHPSIMIGFQTPPFLQLVGFNTAGGWGHCWLFPLERYLRGRVDADSVLLRTTYLTPFDNLRQALALKWAQELGILMNVPALPNSIPDPQVDPLTKKPTTISILPDLTPTGAQGSKTDSNFTYRRTSASYLTAVRTLAAALRNYAGLYNRFTAPYAVPSFLGHIAAERNQVASEVGAAKTCMVLSSYNLYQIPQWAIPGMRDSLTRAISWEIYSSQLTRHPIGEAYQKIAPYVSEIVEEMLSRPWPYEKTPPQVPVPPTFGMGKYDRQNYFSQFIVIANQPDGRRGVMFPRLFGDSPPFVAYAQSEAVNWMEYNENYGDYYTEKFDEISLNTFNSLLACPRAWRLSTEGGWNWRPKLSPADMMAQSITKDPSGAVPEAFSNAGITSGDPSSVDTINLH